MSESRNNTGGEMHNLLLGIASTQLVPVGKDWEG